MVEPLQWRDLGAGEEKLVYRFVHTNDAQDPDLLDDFRSDREAGLEPIDERERQIPELQDGMSAYRSLEHARILWLRIATRLRRRDPNASPRIGGFVAEIRLRPGCGFRYEDLGEPDGHMTIWGDRLRLATAVAEISSVEED